MGKDHKERGFLEREPRPSQGSYPDECHISLSTGPCVQPYCRHSTCSSNTGQMENYGNSLPPAMPNRECSTHCLQQGPRQAGDHTGKEKREAKRPLRILRGCDGHGMIPPLLGSADPQEGRASCRTRSCHSSAPNLRSTSLFINSNHQTNPHPFSAADSWTLG